MTDKRKGLDKSKTCCLYGLWPRSDSELFVFVSVSCCSLLFCNFTLLCLQCCLHRVLLRYFYKLGLQSHTMSDTIDRDNMSTLLLAIISLTQVRAYSRSVHTAPQIIIFRLQFNYGKKTRGFYVHAVLVVSVGRLSRRWTGGLAEFFFPAG